MSFDYANPTFLLEDESEVSGRELYEKEDESMEKDIDNFKSVSYFKLFRYATAFDIILIIISIIMGLTVAGCTIAPFMYYGDILDSFTNDTVTDKLEKDVKSFSIKYTYFGIGIFVATMIQIITISIAAENQVNKIKKNFFQAILKQNISWHDRQTAGILTTRLFEDILQLSKGIGKEFTTAIQFAATFIIGLVLAFWKGWKLALVLTSIMPFIAIMTALLSILVKRATKKELESYATAGGIADEVLTAIRTVISFGSINKESNRYNNELRTAEVQINLKSLMLGGTIGGLDFLSFASFALALWYGPKLIRDGEEGYTIGVVIFVFFTIVIGTFTLGMAVPKIPIFSSAAESAKFIFGVIDRKPELDNFPSDYKNEVIKDDGTEYGISFQGVHFTYPTRKGVKILNNLSFDVKKSESIALVGESGCGKSTVMQLLERFYEPDIGYISINGKELPEYELYELRNIIGIVSQEPILFATTVEENIRLNYPSATKDDIIETCKQANIHNFIQTLTDGYDTLLGEHGTQLSGGQKQRIAIARALIKKPKILLLDEATSALDSESERIVQEALDKASVGRTTIIIAHRLSTVRNVSRIFGMKGGEIVEMGSHDELVNKEGLYYNLLKKQNDTLAEMRDDGDDDNNDDIIEKDGTLRKDSINKPQFLYQRSNSIVSHHSIKSTGSSCFEDDGRMHYTQKEWEDEVRIGNKKVEEEANEEDVEVKGCCGKKKKEKKDEDLPTWRTIFGYNKPELKFIIPSLFLSFIVGGIQPILSILMAKVIGSFGKPEYSEDERYKKINLYAIGMLVTGVVSGSGKLLREILYGKSESRLVTRFRKLYFHSILRQEMAWFDQSDHQTGALISSLSSDPSLITSMSSRRIGMILESVFCVLVALIISFFYGPLLALVILLFLPFMIIAGSVDAQTWKGEGIQQREQLSQNGKIAFESIDNIRTVYPMNAQQQFFDKFKMYCDELYNRVKYKAIISGAALGLAGSLQYFMYPAVFSFGLFLRNQENTAIKMSFENILLVFGVLTFGLMNVGNQMGFIPDYGKAQSAAKLVIDTINRKPMIDNDSNLGKKELNRKEGNVEFENVRFRYPSRPTAKILRGLNIKAKSKEKIALVGESGCGKSTVMQILERFYENHSGYVRLNGENIRDINIKSLREQIGLVQQEPILFKRSIRENIAYSEQDETKIDNERVIEVAKEANIHDFITTLPEGYETNAGSKGTQLSGGQKQRIAIARALYKNPPILLLDEATSALDTESEKIVQEALDKASENRTTIVIAHRLSTIKDASIIYVVKDGKICEYGTHDELLKNENVPDKGIYARQYRTQNR